jgi:hypothetical protein
MRAEFRAARAMHADREEFRDGDGVELIGSSRRAGCTPIGESRIRERSCSPLQRRRVVSIIPPVNFPRD